MISSENCMKFILAIEPDFKLDYERHLEYWENKSKLGHDVAAFSHFVENKLRNKNYQNAAKVFERVEFLLTDKNASDEVQNTFCTSFLENLLNYFTEEVAIFSEFIPLLGPKSREYCKAWDKFTGVKTPGLWD